MSERFIPISERLSKNKIDLKKTALAALLSVGLHAGAIGASSPEIRRNIADQTSEMAINAERNGREFLKRLLASETENDFKNSLIESGDKPSPITFFLKSESFHGISEKESIENAEVFNQLKQQYLAEATSEPNKIKVLYDLSKEEGRYDPDSALLADILKKDINVRRGNCEARAKFMDSLVSEIYPGAEKKLQWFAGDKTKAPHVRLIMKIDKDWYALEGFPEKLNSADLEGSTLTDTDKFMTSYLQKVPNPNETALAGKVVTTNSFISVKFEKPPTKTYGGNDNQETNEDYQKRLTETYEQVALKRLPDLFKVQYLTKAEIDARLDKQKERKTEAPTTFSKDKIEKIKRSGLLILDQDDTAHDLSDLKNIEINHIMIKNNEIKNFSALDLSHLKTLLLDHVKGEIDLSKLKGHRLQSLNLLGQMTIKNLGDVDFEQLRTDRDEYLPIADKIPGSK